MKKKLWLLAFCLLLSSAAFALQDARLLRFPDVNKDLVTFVYAGDVWSVPAAGGAARKLTNHPGIELFPKISPDGRWIAYSAQYSGSRQVYVIPAAGGTPRQLTYYNDAGSMPPRGGYDYVVLDWTADSRKVMVRANRASTSWSRWTAAWSSPCRSRRAAAAGSRPTTSRSATRRSSASSAPGSAPRAAAPRTSGPTT